MNPLRAPSSSSRRGRGAPAAQATRADRVPAGAVAGADAVLAGAVAGADAVPAGAAAPTGYRASLAAAAASRPASAADGSTATWSLQAAGLPEWWRNSSPMGSSVGLYPQGGFTNFLNSNSTPENFHLVGNMEGNTTISPTSLKRTRPVESNAHGQETIDLDADETKEDERTERRLNYTKDEDVRLAAAWLMHSKDPVEGTDRTGDQYWSAVTKEYNKGTEVSRRRNRNQLKIRWDRIKKPVMEFHGCWTSITKVYRSGYSDDQMMDMAETMYAKDHNDKDFTLKHFWKVVKGERKWSAYVKREIEKDKKGASINGGPSPAEVVNLEGDPNKRPPGHRQAKEELHGKKKKPQAYSVISDKVDKFIEVSTVARKDREKMAETQRIMAQSKVEAARLNEKTAEKQLKCKMLDTYRELLLAPTTNMTAQALAVRDKALESMRLALFATDN